MLSQVKATVNHARFTVVDISLIFRYFLKLMNMFYKTKLVLNIRKISIQYDIYFEIC